MCLIIVKPLGTPMIDEILKVTKEAASSNQDGYGFCYKPNAHYANQLYVDKGYMEVDKMITAIEKLNVTDDDELMIHLRMATTGKVMPLNTHPFVVSDKNYELNTLCTSTNKPVVAHNGWFTIKTEEDYSDTWSWVKNVLSKEANFNALTDETLNFNPEKVKEILGYTSKVGIMFPDQNLQLIGNGWVESKGVFYSNSSYKYHLNKSVANAYYQEYYGD